MNEVEMLYLKQHKKRIELIKAYNECQKKMCVSHDLMEIRSLSCQKKAIEDQFYELFKETIESYFSWHPEAKEL